MIPDEYEVMHANELQHWWFRSRRWLLLDMLRRAGRAPGGSLRILDLGCGTGGNTAAYASYGEVVGTDPDRAAVALARQRSPGRYCRASGSRLPFRTGSFDVVVASDVLEHIEDDRAAVAEIARVLSARGSLIFSVPAHPWLFSEHDVALHHFRRYTKPTLRGVLEQGGLRIQRLSYWNTTLFPLIALHRLLARRPQAGRPRSDTRPAPWVLNESLTALLTAEAAVSRWLPLPWGVSLVGLAGRR